MNYAFANSLIDKYSEYSSIVNHVEFDIVNLIYDFNDEITKIAKSNKLNHILSSVELLNDFIKLYDNEFLTKENFNMLFQNITTYKELSDLTEHNSIWLNVVIEKGLWSFSEFLDKFDEVVDSRSTTEEGDPTLFQRLFAKTLFFQNLVQQNAITTYNVDRLIDFFDNLYDKFAFCSCSELLTFYLTEHLESTYQTKLEDSIYKHISKYKEFWNQTGSLLDLAEQYNQHDYALIDLIRFHKMKKDFRRFSFHSQFLSELHKEFMSHSDLYENSRYIADNNLFQFFDSAENLIKILQLNSTQFESFKSLVENDLLRTFDSFDELLKHVSKKQRKLQINI